MPQVPHLRALRQFKPTPGLVLVEGYEAADDGGGGVFRWQTGAAPLDGSIRVASDASKKGFWIRTDYISGEVQPQWFGSLQNQEDHSRLIQAAIDFVVSEGTGAVALGNRVYRCTSRLVVDPTRCALVGNGAILDFSSRPPPDLGSQPIQASLDGAPSGGRWQFEGGTGGWKLSDKTLQHQPEQGRRHVGRLPLRLEKGHRYQVSAEVSRLEGNPQRATISLVLRGAPADDKEVLKRTINLAGPYESEFEWTSEASGVLELRASGQAVIDRLEIREIGLRECILVQATQDSPQNGHLWMSGFRLKGAAGRDRSSGLDGILFHTLVPPKSSRLGVRDVEIQGFDVGVKFMDRAYLINFHNVRIVGPVALYFVDGSEDAGENISFTGCTIGGGHIGIRNNGAQFNLANCSIDFCRQFYVGHGQFSAYGCRFETNRPVAPDQYLFRVRGGDLDIVGGFMMVGGRDFALGNQCDYIFMLDDRLSRAHLRNVVCYNLRTRTGELAGGNGRIFIDHILGGPIKHVARVTKRDAAHNLLGAWPALGGNDLPLDICLAEGTRDNRLQSDRGRIELAATHGPRGTFPLRISKSAPARTPLRVWLLAPFSPDAQVSWELFLKAQSASPAAAERMFVQTQFVQLRGRDDKGRPMFGARQVAHELRHDVNSNDWQRLSAATLDTPAASGPDGYAPSFTTHVALLFDMSLLSAGSELLIDDIFIGKF